MANQWLRLWHDMPTDPKWRTIARASEQSIGLVQAVYLHLLVDASRNVTRGHATVTREDLASALDVTEAEIGAILDAMQGRVLDKMRLLGWDARQPKREDSGDESTGAKSAAQRKSEQRERDRLAANTPPEKQSHGASRNVTLDKDKDKEKVKRATRLPADWIPTPEDLSYASKLGLVNGKVSAEIEKFRDWWIAAPGQKGVKQSWPATWRTWVRKASEVAPGKPGATDLETLFARGNS